MIHYSLNSAIAFFTLSTSAIGFELQVRFVALASLSIFAELLLCLRQSDPRGARVGL